MESNYRYALILEYRGTAYFGSQRQNTLPTVQNELDKALKNMTQIKVKTHFASRTDKGVHAEFQVCHFDIPVLLNLAYLPRNLNKRLPEDIRVVKAILVDFSFHSRHNSVKKTYIYKIAKKPVNAFNSEYSVYFGNLNIKVMQAVVPLFIGTKDFRGFAKTEPNEETIKTVLELKISENKDFYTVKITGTGFLRYMVRSIVGVLARVGKGTFNAELVSEIFMKKDHTLCGKTAPAKGLVLKKIYYPEKYQIKK